MSPFISPLSHVKPIQKSRGVHVYKRIISVSDAVGCPSVLHESSIIPPAVSHYECDEAASTLLGACVMGFCDMQKPKE